MFHHHPIIFSIKMLPLFPLPPEVKSGSVKLLEDVFDLDNPDVELVLLWASPVAGEVDPAQGRRCEGGGGGGVAVQCRVQAALILLLGPPENIR